MELNVEQKIESEAKDTSHASFADIPLEIQIDILSRLSSKLLSRCKCVSKHWNNTLTIRAFLLKLSLSYDKHPQLGFAVHSSVWGKNSLISFELNDDNTPKTTTMNVQKPTPTASLINGRDDIYFNYFRMHKHNYMSDICNDLICLFNQTSSLVGILNIRTRDFIQLPKIPMKCESSFISWYALGFEPVHKVFKVLSISYGARSKDHPTSPITEAAILTVGSKYWIPIDNKNLPSSLTNIIPWGCTTSSLCLDGVIYCVHKNNNSTVLTVVAFDLSREAFTDNALVTTPITMRDMTFRYYLTSLKGCPTLLICKIKSETDELEQWTLFDHKNPNATWNRRIFTNHDFMRIVHNDSRGISTAGSSTLLQYFKMINFECFYWLYDLENSAIE